MSETYSVQDNLEEIAAALRAGLRVECRRLRDGLWSSWNRVTLRVSYLGACPISYDRIVTNHLQYRVAPGQDHPLSGRDSILGTPSKSVSGDIIHVDEGMYQGMIAMRVSTPNNEGWICLRPGGEVPGTKGQYFHLIRDIAGTIVNLEIE